MAQSKEQNKFLETDPNDVYEWSNEEFKITILKMFTYREQRQLKKKKRMREQGENMSKEAAIIKKTKQILELKNIISELRHPLKGVQ